MDASDRLLHKITQNYIIVTTDPEHSPDLRAALYNDIRSLTATPRKKKNKPRTDFLCGYFAIALPELESLTMAAAVDLLEQAHEAGVMEATIMLACVYNNFHYPVPRQLQRPARAILLMEQIEKADHPFGLFHIGFYSGLESERSKNLASQCLKDGHVGGFFLKGLRLMGQEDQASKEKAIRCWRKGLETGRAEDVLSAPVKAWLMMKLGQALYDGECAKYSDREEGFRLIQAAAKCNDRRAKEWLAENSTPASGEKQNPAEWLSEKLTIHDGEDEDKETISLLPGNPLIKKLDRRNSGQYFTLSYPEDKAAKRGDSHKPSIRTRIHFPDEHAVSLRQTLDKQDEISDDALEQIIAPLEKLPGLCSMKAEIRELLNYAMVIKQRNQHGLNIKSLGVHMVFTGKPGTGKTHLARMVGSIFYQAGLLEDGHVIEADCATLTGEYIGWTTSKTQLACEAALGGVLFIDEAYMLTENNWSFGIEAVDVIMKMMEDFNGRFVVIAAGYQNKMNGFLLANPGLRSRFSKTIAFPDYTAEENVEVFEVFCAENDYVLDPAARLKLLAYLKSLRGLELERFANARGVRKVFDEAIRQQARRLLRRKDNSKEDLMLIRAEDLPGAAPVLTDGNVSYLGGKPGKSGGQ